MRDLVALPVISARREEVAGARMRDFLPLPETGKEQQAMSVPLVSNDAIQLLQFVQRVLDAGYDLITVIRHAHTLDQLRAVIVHTVIFYVTP